MSRIATWGRHTRVWVAGVGVVVVILVAGGGVDGGLAVHGDRIYAITDQLSEPTW